MPVAQKSATIFSMPFWSGFAATCSAICFCTCTERSRSTLKAPQRVWSAGMGLAASHLALALALMSAQMFCVASMSAGAKRMGCSSWLSSSLNSGAGAAATGAGFFWQPARASATAADSTAN